MMADQRLATSMQPTASWRVTITALTHRPWLTGLYSSVCRHCVEYPLSVLAQGTVASVLVAREALEGRTTEAEIVHKCLTRNGEIKTKTVTICDVSHYLKFVNKVSSCNGCNEQQL